MVSTISVSLRPWARSSGTCGCSNSAALTSVAVSVSSRDPCLGLSSTVSVGNAVSVMAIFPSSARLLVPAVPLLPGATLKTFSRALAPVQPPPIGAEQRDPVRRGLSQTFPDQYASCLRRQFGPTLVTDWDFRRRYF